MGTRIIAINKDKKYVVQRYVINPEARQTKGKVVEGNVDATTAATIHREKPEYPNMDWYAGDEEIKIFTLEPKTGGNTDGKVTGLISDLRLASYKVTEITDKVKKSTDKSHFGETRLKLDLPVTNKPIVVDVKVPYKDENGGVGTGMDWREGDVTYWKSDFYERVSDIKTAGLVSDTGGTIVGSYLAEGSLDVTNSLKTYGFKIKKVKEDKKTVIPGAVFKLTGPGDSKDERFMTTGSDGMVSFDGLKPGTYKLEETNPAPGYEKANTDWTVTITKDGKIYIKANNAGISNSNTNLSVENLKNVSAASVRSLFANPMRRNLLESFSSDNSGLEVGGNLLDLANPLRAGNGWEIVDNNSSTKPTTRQDASDSDYGQLIDTKIIEIDKVNNRYKQVFIYKPGVTDKRNRNIKFHRAYDNYNISPNEVRTRVFQVPAGTSLANINESSDIDAIAGKTDISKNIKFTVEGTKKIQTTDINTRYPGTILIEVETNYNENQPIGLGSNYDFNTGSQSTRGHKCWLEKSYKNEASVPVIGSKYNITEYSSLGGSVRANTTSSEAGKEISLTISENQGYKYKENSLQVLEKGTNNPVRLNGNKFTMPASDVIISAVFEKVYKVHINVQENGTISASPSENVSAGDTVTLTLTPQTGFKLKQLSINSTSGSVAYTKVNETTYTFTMPASDVGVNVSYEKPQDTAYNIKIDENIIDGRVSADASTATKGTTVNLKPTPNPGFKLGTLIVTADNGDSVQVTNNSFTMPESNVTISATFVKDPQTYKYKVNIASDIQNGSVTASTDSALAGASVTLTATAISGYELDKFTVTADNGDSVQVTNNSFIMPAANVSVTASFKQIDLGTEIQNGQVAQITNKQTGLDLKIYKKDRYDRKLEGAIFTIRKTDEKYETFDQNFGVKTGTSNDKGLVEFKDKNDKPVRLPEGYYVIEETAAPLGYRKANAPWKVQVVEENGQLVAKYKGPEETPQSFIEKNKNLDIKEANGVKYATKITHIDTESRTFIQRVYIDTRGKNGTVNVQIKPKHKREEIDRPGLPPVTIKEGVKTAYRSTYKITGIDGDPNEAQMIKILNDYDVSYPDVTVVNTARWRPFDWGFDEDQLNLEPGVYYIDIEGFYDTSIIDRNVTNEVAIDSNYNFTNKEGTASSTEPVLKDPYVNNNKTDLPDEDLGKIDIDIEFFDGAREFQQLYNDNGRITYKALKDENGKDEASFQSGAETLRQYLEYNYGKTRADNWANSKPAGQKYANALGKKVYIGSDPYITGKITPTVTPGTQGYKNPSSTIKTSIDISSLYSSNKTNTVPQEGLSIENDAERYNITFSKHGKETDKDSVEEITKRRLEGAVFKLEKRVREGIYEEVEGSYVSSAFNGYFGFRGLEPGRYRLIEVQAPKGYKPIDGPLLHFSVETVSIVSKLITDPRTGENIKVDTVGFYFPGNDKSYKFEELEMHDPVTNEVIKFKDAKNADLETTRIINPLDKTKEVPLRDLSIKFPGEIKDKEGKLIKDTYKLSEIQITPTSNGYISLEYDKANGVYQYIKEKSTTEKDGLLVDYVTSATAKNMGKIVNEKPGKGSVMINKVDENGTALKGTANDKGELTAGAKFRLTNLTDVSKPVEKTVGTDGKLSFEGLKIGNYKLEEIESPDGHINTKQVWHFTVGGEGLDPYSGDIARTGKDLSDKITLETTEMKVLNPESKTPRKKGEIHPHYGESMEFTNKFTLAENTKINPGDYFVLNISDNMDLHGIFENSISNLDVVADGVGTIAKADYNREAGTLTYTFTKYADTYTLIDFSNKLTGFIDLYKVKTSDGTFGGQKVGFGIGKDTSQYKDIKVIYDLRMEKDNNRIDYLNMTSKIVKYNQETGEFLHYFYINRDKENSRTNSFYYIPSQDVENVVITKYRLSNNTNVENDMPESFGVNENSTNITRSGYGVSRQSMAKGELLELPFENGMSSRDSYIVKVTGRVSGKDKSSYQAESVLQLYDYYRGKLFVDRFDGVYGFKNESTADAKLSIQAVNPSNKIKFKKVNNFDEAALQGATFQLYKKIGEEKWNSHGQPITTGENGLIEYSELPEGEYQLKETTAPEGYVKPDGPVAEFKVDESGKIFRKEYYKDGKGQKQEKYVEEPGVVPITIVNRKEHKIIFKKTGPDGKNPLTGAEFEVWYKKNLEDKAYSKDLKLYEKTANGKTERLVLIKDETAPDGYKEVQKFTSDAKGLVEFKFYENGYYALKEIKAPHGHIRPRDYVKEFAVADGEVKEKTFTDINIKKDESKEKPKDLEMTFIVNGDNKELTYYPGDESATSTIPKSHFELIADNIGLNWRGNGANVSEVKIYHKKSKNDETWTEVKDISSGILSSNGSNILFSFHNLLKKINDTKSTDPIKSTDSFKIVLRAKLESTNTDDSGNLSTKTSITQTLKLPKGNDGADIDQVRTISIESIEKSVEAGTYENIKYTKKTEGGKEIKEPDPMVIVNKQAIYPFTGGNGTLFYALCGFVVMLVGVLIYDFYQRKKKTLRLKA